MFQTRKSTLLDPRNRSHSPSLPLSLPLLHSLSLSLFQQELTDINLKLKNELNHLINECQANKQDVQQVDLPSLSLSLCSPFSLSGQITEHCTSTIENTRRALFAERKEMEKKIEQLMEQVKRAKKKIDELQREKKETKARQQNLSQKLNDKSQLIEAKLDEIKQKELSLQ